MRDDHVPETNPAPTHEVSGVHHEAPGAVADPQAPPPFTEGSDNSSPSAQAAALHARIRALVRIERQALREIAVGMAAMQRELLFRELGYAGIVEYGEQAFGFRPGKTRQLARLGRLLPDLPVLDAALRTGALGWTKARTVGQVATPETEGAWVERALQLNSRELEDLVSRASMGDEPPDPAEEWEPPRHIWARFRLDPFHFERLMQALALLRHQLDDPDMSASQLLLYMAELCLDGDLLADEGDASTGEPDLECCQDAAREGGHSMARECHGDAAEERTPPTAHECCEEDAGEDTQPTTHVCCEQATGEDAQPQTHVCCEEATDQDAQPTTHVCCEQATDEDAQATTRECFEEATGEGTRPTTHVCCEDNASEDGDRGQQLPQQLPRGENAYPINYRIIEHRCPCCDKAWTEGRAGRIEMDERDRALAECDAEVVAGDDSAGTPGHMSRTIPPAIRRAVLIRDGGRCQVPGCRHNKHIELHHIVPWATSRSHEPDGLVCLCSTHHAMVHRDVLQVSRDHDGELRWKRGLGEPLAVVASVWGERGELEYADLREFEGPPGSWPLLQGLWGPIEPPEQGRVPRGRQQVRIGDDQRMAPAWMARNIPV